MRRDLGRARQKHECALIPKQIHEKCIKVYRPDEYLLRAADLGRARQKHEHITLW